MDLQLGGRRALVTGGTRGIGRAVVEALAAEGAVVAFCARTDTEVKEAEQALQAAGQRVYGAAVDVRDPGAVRGWVSAAAEHLGGIDVLVANVSAMAINDDEEHWRSAFETDLMHTVRAVETAVPYLEASDAASVIAISSVSAREIDMAARPYGVIKAAIVHYVHGLAVQLADRGIRANTVSPGNTYFDGGVWQQIEHAMPEPVRPDARAQPDGRMGTPAEVAYAVVMLARPRASRISGTNLVVDGALTRGVQL